MSSSSLNPSARTYIPPSTGTVAASTTAPTSARTFPKMLNLQEELILYILSFVSDVPYESSSDANESTLTHAIPLVCKKFHFQYSKSDYLWKGALIRLVTKEPLLWGHGVKLFLTSHPAPAANIHTINSNQEGEKDDHHDTSSHGRDNGNASTIATAIRLVTDAGRSMEQILQAHRNNGYFSNRYNRYNETQLHQSNAARPIFCELYRYVLFSHIRFTSPLFYMPDNVQLGQEFGLHFFEPRYRLLITEVMAPYPNHVNGEPILIKSNDKSANENDHLPSSYPTFIYANKSPLARGTTACIVEVRQCVIHANSTADVYLNPVSYAKIEHVWQRPNSHNLYEARVLKMNSEETDGVKNQTRNNMIRWPAPSGGVNPVDNIDPAVLLQLLAATHRGGNNHTNNDNEERG